MFRYFFFLLSVMCQLTQASELKEYAFVIPVTGGVEDHVRRVSDACCNQYKLIKGEPYIVLVCGSFSEQQKVRALSFGEEYVKRRQPFEVRMASDLTSNASSVWCGGCMVVLRLGVPFKGSIKTFEVF